PAAIDPARREVHEARQRGDRVVLGPDGYGVVTLGHVAVFFQMVRPATRIGRGMPAFFTDPPRLLALLLSAFVHAALLILMFLALAEQPVQESLELSPDLIRRFMVTPPPEDILEEVDSGGTNTEDPGIRDREEAGG